MTRAEIIAELIEDNYCALLCKSHPMKLYFYTDGTEYTVTRGLNGPVVVTLATLKDVRAYLALSA